jgi:hypothetical protein
LGLNFTFFATINFNAVAALKVGTALAAILMGLPVAGFLPIRAALCVTAKRPKPDHEISSSLASTSLTALKTVSTFFSASDFDVLSVWANWSINAFLSIMVFPRAFCDKKRPFIL